MTDHPIGRNGKEFGSTRVHLLMSMVDVQGMVESNKVFSITNGNFQCSGSSQFREVF